MKTVAFACGGTLGHINPALAMAEYLKEYYRIIFISSDKEKRNNTYKDYPYQVFYFNSSGFNRKNLLKNIQNIKNNIKVRKEINQIFINENVDLVISMGGSIGTLAVLSGKKLKIKTMIHEQNAIIGLGNKIVCRAVDRVLLSYPIKNLRNSSLVGNPVKVKNNVMKDDNRKEDVILIFGGSNGAEMLNDFFISNINNINTLNKKIVLIVGDKYYQKNYQKINNLQMMNFEIIKSVSNMDEYYKRAYIVISRSGATTLCEIMNYQKIAIVIPSPNVTNNHQYYNALYYSKKECLKMLEEKDLNLRMINEIINELSDDNIRSIITNNIKKNTNTNVKELFKKEIVQLLGDF